MWADNVVVRERTTAELTTTERAGLRGLFAAAWPGGRFTEDDFDHAMRGPHWLAEVNGVIVSHTSLDERWLEAGGRRLRTGYLEAVATLPAFERRGIASHLVGRASAVVRAEFELGALSTGVPGFYLRLGWERWRGPTSVRMTDGVLVRTEEDDDAIFVLRTPTTPPLTLTEPLVCEWRAGDVW
jgi:aminoglycoside 2'-N-acetyltransferase I